MQIYLISRDTSESLTHSGIKGQKWGIRRFQNEDGTLTAEGKQRYGNLKRMVGDLSTNSKNALDNVSLMLPAGNGKRSHGDYSKISDAELRDRVNRLNLEEQYARLTNDMKYKRSGSEIAKEILQTTGAVLGIVGSGIGIYLALKTKGAKFK